MANETIINPELTDSSATILNPELAADWAEPDELQAIPLIASGTVLCGQYEVVSQMEVASGEADLYLCRCEGTAYIAKIYKRHTAIKPEITEVIKRIDSPYIAQIFATGNIGGFPIEILPYYPNGSLQGKHFSEQHLVADILPCLNEGLHTLHEAGLIHKDLKPANIMMNEDGKTVTIIDFGISSLTGDGRTVLVTKTGMTPEYSAPETFRNLFLRESDYYSLGITIYELLCGYTPYANMLPEEIEQYISVQKIPFPDTLSPKMKDLITALTYYDLSNRTNPENPNRRWTYPELKRWLNGENLIIPGEGIGNAGRDSIPAFVFQGREYSDSADLTAALSKDWDAGKKMLYNGKLRAYYQRFYRKAAEICKSAEDAAAQSNGHDDRIFWKTLYQLHPKQKAFLWKGHQYESLPALGREILEQLWKQNSSLLRYYESILSEKLLSEFIAMTAPNNAKLKKAANAIELSYVEEKNNRTDFLRTLYLAAYTLSGQKILMLNDQQIRTTGELAAYMKQILSKSSADFDKLCGKLIDRNGNLDAQLEAWLIACGKEEELGQWKNTLKE